MIAGPATDKAHCYLHCGFQMNPQSTLPDQPHDGRGGEWRRCGADPQVSKAVIGEPNRQTPAAFQRWL